MRALPQERKRLSPRVAYLRERYGEAVHAELVRQDAGPHRFTGRPAPAAFDYVLAFDPTSKGIYLQAVVRWVLSGAIRAEDGRRVRDTLSRFHAALPRTDF